jgi:alpha-ketoglutarate-dependent taurine dioxygenase
MTKSDVTESAQSYVNTPDPQSPLDVEPVGGRIGAEVRGIALSRVADDSTVAAIRAALVRHKVLFFRNQQLDDQEHETFAARLGRPERRAAPAAGSRYLMELNSSDGYAANIWHTDQTYVRSPPDMTMLRAVVSCKAGGDTSWANTAVAYTELPDPLKLLADTLWGIHSSSFDYAQVFGQERDDKDKDEKWLQTVRPTVVEAEHPVVRVHPDTGERTLLVGSYLQRFVGLNGADSRHLMSILQDHITQPENTVRWRWQAWRCRYLGQSRYAASCDRRSRDHSCVSCGARPWLAPLPSQSTDVKAGHANRNRRRSRRDLRISAARLPRLNACSQPANIALNMRSMSASDMAPIEPSNCLASSPAT